jgi:hypothetical protein
MMKKFENIEEKSPFRVPEGYFEEVNKKIIAATSGNNTENRRTQSSFRIRPYLMAAASIAGFILLSYSAVRVLNHHRINQLHSELSREEEFSQYLNDLDIYSLEENAGSVGIYDQGPDVSKAEIIDYLVLQDIEISDIYEQL